LKEIVKEQKVLILFDRNYASIEFISFLEESGIKYIIRLADGQYKAERDAMPEDDCFVQLQHTKSRMARIRTKKAQRACQIEKQQASAVRITEAVLDNGEETAFISNLKEETGQQIIELYRSRWAIEGSYHTLKNKMKFESVTGKDSVYVKQDFSAHMLVFNMIQD
jgi:transposase